LPARLALHCRASFLAAHRFVRPSGASARSSVYGGRLARPTKIAVTHWHTVRIAVANVARYDTDGPHGYCRAGRAPARPLPRRYTIGHRPARRVC